MKTLLVVDDNEQNRYMLQALFCGHGYAVNMAADGVEALERAREHMPDLLLTDILMPRMDGYSLCRQWKGDEMLKQIPLVFYTGTYTDPKDRQFALDMGADCFLLKPAEPEVLLAAVEGILAGSHAAQRPSSANPVLEEAGYFKQYNETLIRKLEEKMAELESANRRLEAEAVERRRAERLLELRLRLLEYAVDHSLDDCLQKALDEIGELVDSPIGFYHFVGEDQQTLFLQQWSTRTLLEFCRAEGKGAHYPIQQAGVWADCARLRKPIIHNNYASLDNKQGMPDGHAQVIRELVVPIIRHDRLVAILGVGNKPADYVQEDAGVISFLADVTWTIVERKQAETAISTVHQRLRRFIDASIVGVIVANTAGDILEANDYYLNLVGATRDDLDSGRVNWRNITPPEWIPADTNAIRELREYGTCAPYEKECFRPDGTRVSVLLTGTMLPGPGEEIAAFAVDLTERNSLEVQLRQSQKMEAVGLLAGGVAHDFNNILQALLGYGSMLLERIPDGDEMHEFAEEIVHGTERAAALTRQLLAFSRRQILEMEDLDLNDVVKNLARMIRRVIGEDIEMNIIEGQQLGLVHADCGQVEQVLLNLCVNARDAMPEGGVLTVETEKVVIGEEYCAVHTWASPGSYVMLSVSDTGHGMDAQTQEHIFEPFFTTKELGKGTGLGLATVYGIVRQHQGMIQVYSEVDAGTTFKVYLPNLERTVEKKEHAVNERAGGGTETILLAEDDASILKLAERILKDAGYTVLTASNGREALDVFERRGNDIALVILDVIMPKLGGKAVYDALMPRFPQVRFLFTSGYSPNAVHTNYVMQEGIELIQKPYAPDALLRKVRLILDPAGEDRRI